MPETMYGSSGDIREIINAGSQPGDNRYIDEREVRGALIQRARKDNSRVINGKLEPVYPDNVPFASGDVPLLIDTIANLLSVWSIKRDKHPGPAPLSADIKEEYYDKPIGWLDALAERKMQLTELTSAVNYPNVFGNRKDITPVFDMDDELKQRVDPELLNDIAGERE